MSDYATHSPDCVWETPGDHDECENDMNQSGGGECLVDEGIYHECGSVDHYDPPDMEDAVI